MKIQKAPLEFDLDVLPVGMSKEAIEDHYNVLYKGYVRKYNEIQEKLEQADQAGANATYSEYRELKQEEIFTANAIRLHEAYFAGLGGDGNCHGIALDWIDRDFGSFENWVGDLRGSAMSARGWVVLAYDLADGLLHNYATDIHSEAVWTSIPLMVLDVYEHAYYLDFTTDRKRYIESWLQNCDWDYAADTIRRFDLEKVRRAA